MLSRSVRMFFVLVVVGLLAGVALVGRAPEAMAAQETLTANVNRTITVVGSGEVKAAPDVARVNLGVEVTAPTVSAATDEAEQRMTDVLAALKAAGIADKDIQTSNFSINFEQQNPNPTPRVESATAVTDTVEGVYHVSNMVQVTLRDMTAVGDVIDAAIKAGANNIWGVSFDLENTGALEEQARKAAVTDARARAESLAELNGVKVGEVIAISEVIGASPAPMFAQAARATGGGVSVEPGEVSFATQIQIVYGIQ
jgi:uncharacterized protein YggE